MLNKILEQIRQLPEDQFIELIREIEKKESEKKRAEEEKNTKKAFEIGDKICEVLGINGFPFSCMTKCWSAPYEPFVREYEDIWEGIRRKYYNEDNRPTEETWNKALEYFEEFYNLIPESWCFEEKDAGNCYPGYNDYMFYLRGGKTQFVTEDEFVKFYFG